MLLFVTYLTSLSGTQALNDWMIINNEAEIMWREVVVA
jgi:hypothetical protein